MNRPVIKVCGMQHEENIRAIEQAGADMIGFIFYARSPRVVTGLPTYMPKHAKRVGVFVNEEPEVVKEKAATFGLDYLQLHGSESPEYCKTLFAEGYKLIKNFPVATAEDLKQTQAYEKYCELFLFDTKCEGHGGSGQQFDWNVLSHYNGTLPFLLSGGIGPESAEALHTFHHPKLMGYDLNSRFEIAPGIKEIALIQPFIEQFR